MLKKINYPSPNFEPRPSGISPDLIILHYTDLTSVSEALTRLCDAELKVSAHFLISKDGLLYQLVDPVHRAWHAGVSSWQGESDINSRSIGIELDNFGHQFGPEPFPPAQINTLVKLLDELTKTYEISPHRILGHSDVAPLRKKDPGELFPWLELATKGFGLWPSSLAPTSSAPMSVLEIQKALCEIGYSCPQTGIWDEESIAVCKGFQSHFTQQEITGHSTDLTCDVLRRLLRNCNKGKPPLGS